MPKHAILTAASHAERAVGHLHGYQALAIPEDRPPLALATAGAMPDSSHRAQFQGRDDAIGIDR